MFVYWVIWFYIVINTSILRVNTIFSKIGFLVFVSFLSLFIGFRYQVGGDWDAYIYIYSHFKYISFTESLYVSDIAYSIINYFSQYLGFVDIVLVNTVCGVIIALFLYLFCMKLKEYWLILLMYYPYHILSVSLGYTRQAVALSILTYAFTFLIEKKVLAYLFFIILAAMFHKTSIIFLVFLPLLFFKNKYWLYLYQLSSLLLISYILYLSILYEKNYYTRLDTHLESSGVFMRLSMHIIPIILYVVHRKSFFLSHYGRKNILLLDYFVLLIFFCFSISFLLSTLSDRFNLYLVFFDLFVISSVYSFMKKSSKKILLVILILYYTLFIFVWLFFGEWASKAWIPYSNYITNYLFEKVF